VLLKLCRRASTLYTLCWWADYHLVSQVERSAAVTASAARWQAVTVNGCSTWLTRGLRCWRWAVSTHSVGAAMPYMNDRAGIRNRIQAYLGRQVDCNLSDYCSLGSSSCRASRTNAGWTGGCTGGGWGYACASLTASYLRCACLHMQGSHLVM
jgi:hypothetical protein